MKSGEISVTHASEGKGRADQGFLSAKLRDWTADFRKKFAPWIKLYKKINGFGYSVLRNPLVPANTPQILAWTLYLRALSSYQAALILAERGLDAECKTVLWSLPKPRSHWVRLKRISDLLRDSSKAMNTRSFNG